MARLKTKSKNVSTIYDKRIIINKFQEHDEKRENRVFLEDSRNTQFVRYLSRLVHLMDTILRDSASAECGLLTLYVRSS